MKRLVILAILAAFAFGFASTASAVEMAVSGQWAIEASWMDNFDLQNERATANEEDFNVFMRARQQFEFIANENLKAVLATEVGTGTWGQGAFAIGASAVGIEVRRAYLDFNWPDTEVNIKAGHQPIYLPTAVGSGSMIMGEEVAAVAISSPVTDYLSVLGGWARAYNGFGVSATTGILAGEQNVDMWFLAAPIALDGFNITPFFAYTDIGGGLSGNGPRLGVAAAAFPGILTSNNTADNSDWSMWHGGIAFTMDYFDPFVFKADVEYGSLDAGQKNNDRSGWMGALALEYTGWDVVTPELFFVYTSGEDGNSSKDSGESERMPLVRSDWSVGSFWFGGDWGLNGGSLNGGNMVGTMGFWTLGLSLKDFSFLEGMSHTVNILYIQGTNDKNSIVENYVRPGNYGRYLTEDDDLWEFDLNTQYSIYDELTAYLELGYIANNIDDNKWRNAGAINAATKGEDAYKLSMGAAYVF